MTVDGALIQDELGVDIFPVNDLTVAVKLVNMALGAEGDEHRQRTEVVYVVINGADAEGAEVGYDHGAVEGAHIKYGLGYQAEVIAHPDKPDSSADKEACRGCCSYR